MEEWPAGEPLDEYSLGKVCVCPECGFSWRANILRVGASDPGFKKIAWGFGHKKCFCGANPQSGQAWAGLSLCGDEEIVDKNTTAMFKKLRSTLALAS